MKKLIAFLTCIPLLFSSAQTTSGTSTTVFAATSDITVANTSTETSLTSGGVGTTTVAANSLYVGRTYRLVFYGYMSTAVILPTLTVRVKCGTATLATASFTALVASLNSQEFSGVFTFTCRTTGGSGTIIGQGSMHYSSSTLSVGPSNLGRMEDFKMTAPATIDTTIANTFDVTAQWGTASTSNSLTRTNMILEVLN